MMHALLSFAKAGTSVPLRILTEARSLMGACIDADSPCCCSTSSSSSGGPSLVAWQQLTAWRQHHRRWSSVSSSQKIPYSLRSGTPRPSPWPEFETIKKTKAGAVKWHRSLYRFPDDCEAELQDRSLTLSGRAGTVVLDLAKLDPSGLVAFKSLQLPCGTAGQAQTQAARLALALATPDKERFKSFVGELDASVRGVTVGYLVGITVKGVGYRSVELPVT